MRGAIAALSAAGVLAACVGTQSPVAFVAPAGDHTVPPLAPVDVTTPVPATTVVPTTPAVPATDPPAAPAPIYLAAGIHEQQVEVDGQVRRWLTVVPPGTDGGAPAGIVIALHGVGGRGADMRSVGLEPLAASQRIVVAYPDAFGGAWNDGRPGADPAVPGVVVDDIRFLRLLIEHTAAATGAAGRVAVVGFSNGAVMAGRVACDLADGVAAVALVAGTAGQGFERTCRPAGPLAVLVVAGSNDRVVPYAGGRVPDWGIKKRGFVAGVDDFVAFWRVQSGCASSQPVPGVAPVSAVRGVDCRAGAGVVRYRVNGGGHEWFRLPALDTTGVVWDFLSRRFPAAA